MQVMEIDQVIEECKEDYEFEEEQLELLKSIYTRKIANLNNPLTLTKDDIYTLEKFSDGEEGMKECEVSFNEMNIFFEK
jgi:hypothetical protein